MTSAQKSKARLKRAVDSVGMAIAQSRLHASVLAWVAKRRRDDRWCVAFSGGADSMALLLLLCAHWPARRDRLTVLHFNHGLRGRESEADERFCRKVCATLGVKLRTGRWRRASKSRRKSSVRIGTSLDAAAIPNRKPSEAEARAVRHEFFAREMKREHSRVLWLAHQQDDIAESMLMRLARGSGIGGLAAPRPIQKMSDGRIHVRPLLTLKKRELMEALETAGTKWREDSSNAGDDFFRNRIRAKVLPAWIDAAGRDALAGAALAREKLEEDENALETWVDRLLAKDRADRLNLTILSGAPRAIVRRALHRWLLAGKQPVDLSRRGFEVLLELVERAQPTRFSLGRQGFAVIRNDKLQFETARRRQ